MIILPKQLTTTVSNTCRVNYKRLKLNEDTDNRRFVIYLFIYYKSIRLFGIAIFVLFKFTNSFIPNIDNKKIIYYGIYANDWLV